jgi:peptide deformylase
MAAEVLSPLPPTVSDDPKTVAQDLAKAMRELAESRRKGEDNPGHPEKVKNVTDLMKEALKQGLVQESDLMTLLDPSPAYEPPPAPPPALPQEEEEAKPIPPKHRGVPWKRLLLLGLLIVYGAGILLGATNRVDLNWRPPPPPGVQFRDPHNGNPVPPGPGKQQQQSSNSNNNASSSSSSSTFASLPGMLLWPISVPFRWVYTHLTADSTKAEKERALVVFPMVDTLSAEECILVRPEDLKSGNGRLMGNTVGHQELRTSMIYHMSNRRLSGMCAQHVGLPACYCILDMKHKYRNSTLVTSPEDYIELFNPRIIGISRNKIVQVQERNIFCAKQYFAKRFEAITVEYLDGNGNLWERDFNGTHSFNLQHAAEIHRGIRTCMDDAADLLLLLMRGRLGGGPERDSFERQMLFSNTEVHRNERPSVPQALPTPILPRIEEESK